MTHDVNEEAGRYDTLITNISQWMVIDGVNDAFDVYCLHMALEKASSAGDASYGPYSVRCNGDFTTINSRYCELLLTDGSQRDQLRNILVDKANSLRESDIALAVVDWFRPQNLNAS